MFFKHGRQISLRRFILFAGDALCVVGSLILAVFLRFRPIDASWAEYLFTHLPSLLGISVIFLLVFYAGGMYERETLTRKSQSTVLPILTVIVSLLVCMVVFYARFKVDIGRGILMLAGFFAVLSTCGLRHLYRIAVGYGFLSRNTLVVGDGEAVERVVDLLHDTDDSGFKVYGIVSCTNRRQGEFAHGIPVLGHLGNLRDFAEAYEIETIIVATSQDDEQDLLAELRPLRYGGVEILDYVSLYEEIAEEIPLDHINDEWLMSAAMNSSVIHIRKIKRMLDILVSLVGLVVTLPIMLIAMIGIRLDSRGSVLYRQRRAQLEGRPYTLYKLRTMRQNAESGRGAVWASKFDSRVTRVGRFLRKWRIDEIPQLINVLRGEMSLVGPRPERPEFIETLAEQIPFYKERLFVLPGITGWAQVKFPYAASVEAARKKLQYDLYYNKHMSFLLDVKILLRTFRTIIEGIRHSEDDMGGGLSSEGEVILGGQLKVIPSDDEEETADEQTA